MFNFDGDSKSSRTINLGGSRRDSKRSTKEVIRAAQLDRQRREFERKQWNAAKCIQTTWRTYSHRKHLFQSLLKDLNEITSKDCDHDLLLLNHVRICAYFPVSSHQISNVSNLLQLQEQSFSVILAHWFQISPSCIFTMKRFMLKLWDDIQKSDGESR
jgi:hypothetical protein